GRRGRVPLRQARRRPGAEPRRGCRAPRRRAQRPGDGPRDRAARAPGAAAQGRGLPAQRRGARGGDRADPGWAGNGQALVRDLHAGLRRTAMDATTPTIAATGTDPDTGYTRYRLGGFEFARDEYFAHVSWPKGSHIIEIDRFLRAMV